MAYYIQLLTIIDLLATVIVIGLETTMTERVQVDMCFTWETRPSLGCLRSSPLSHYQHAKPNMWQPPSVFVMQYGSEVYYRSSGGHKRSQQLFVWITSRRLRYPKIQCSTTEASASTPATTTSVRECVANQEIQVEYRVREIARSSCRYFHKAPQVRRLYQDQDVARNDKSSLRGGVGINN